MGPLRPETFARHELLSALVEGAAAALIFFGSFESLKAALSAAIFWGWGKIYIIYIYKTILGGLHTFNNCRQAVRASETLEKTCKATDCIISLCSLLIWGTVGFILKPPRVSTALAAS